MDELSDVKILILAGRQASARRWAEMLQPCKAQLWLGPGEMPPSERPEVTLTDSGEPQDGEVGVVRIGPVETAGRAPADVRLPEDVTARELRLACRLLAQIVRLRRRERSGVELRRRLCEEALTDPLTGLPNRRAWDRAVGERLAAAGGPLRLCVALLDLDHFKPINDAHGHAVGDEVLRASGRAVCDGLRQDDFVARLGGDEFGLLLWVPDDSTAGAVVDRVRAALPSRLAAAATHAVTASAGYQVAPTGEPSVSPSSSKTLYAAAAAALHAAKQQGRDRTVGG